MRKIVLDIENTTTKLTDKYTDYSPYNPYNKLVSIGWMTDGPVNYLFFNHNDMGVMDDVMYRKLKADIAGADTMIAHNTKYDFQWMAEAGFKVDHLKLHDTMIREYVMSRGVTNNSLKLYDLSIKYDVSRKKAELVEDYYKRGIQMDAIPMRIVQEYGEADVVSCWEVWQAQEERLNRDGNKILIPTVDMMHEFCYVLADMERSGVCIDHEALEQVKEQFTTEATDLKRELTLMVRDVMGDTPVNFDSPQQLSQVIYSRRIKAGKEEEWLKTFNIGKDDRGKLLKRPKMSYNEYAHKVQSLTDVVLKTEVERCTDCEGKGTFIKLTKKGIPYKKLPKCKTCEGQGLIFKELNDVAGYKMKPMNINFTTVSGFSTSQTFLEELVEQANEKGKESAKSFIEKIVRLSSISSHLSNFCGGIGAFRQVGTSLLHPNFNQCITATGRLSSTRPNLQNQPREQTFPIRKVFVSRWADIGGELGEVDFSQLEFRAAVHLAEDKNGKRDILNGIDIHAQTRDVITAAGQPMDRQESKSRTFKPLYGGFKGSDAETEYFRAFLKELYPDIGRWHRKLDEEALSSKIVTLPTGRQYIFPDVKRTYYGTASRHTQIVNYPVQGFATADIVPIAIIRLFQEIKAAGLRSKLVLTVHDSVVVDIYPGEKEAVIEILKQIGKYAEEELVKRYDINMFVPLTCEVKCGVNLMEVKKVA